MNSQRTEADMNIVDLGISYNRSELSEPVATLNPASTLRDRIFFCAGMARSLQNLVDHLQTDCNPDTARLAELFNPFVDPLAAVLNQLYEVELRDRPSNSGETS